MDVNVTTVDVTANGECDAIREACLHFKSFCFNHIALACMLVLLLQSFLTQQAERWAAANLSMWPTLDSDAQRYEASRIMRCSCSPVMFLVVGAFISQAITGCDMPEPFFYP